MSTELTQALKDAATSLETISRLAGKMAYLGDDGEKIPTYMEHHDQVRGYAASRATCAREALVAHEALAAVPVEPTAFVHWPLNGPPKLVWYSNKALESAVLKTYEGHQPDLLLYAHPAPQPTRADSSDEPMVTVHVDGSMRHMQWLRPLPDGPTKFDLYERPALAAVPVGFDAEGFRAWVLANLPDDTIIGSSAWWADHLAAWAKRFAHPAPQPKRCPYCDDTGDVHSADGEWRGVCTCPAGPAPQPQQATDWRTPTTQHQRMSDAVTLLCAGKRPDDAMVQSWLDGSSEDLQSFAANHGPAWAQGIGLLDAASLMADQPTEGVEHETRPKAQPQQAENTRVTPEQLTALRRGLHTGKIVPPAATPPQPTAPAPQAQAQPITEAEAIKLWHGDKEAHRRESAFEWYAAGLIAAQHHYGIATPASAAQKEPT